MMSSSMKRPSGFTFAPHHAARVANGARGRTSVEPQRRLPAGSPVTPMTQTPDTRSHTSLKPIAPSRIPHSVIAITQLKRRS